MRRFQYHLISLAAVIALGLCLAGCDLAGNSFGISKKAEPYDGTDYLAESELKTDSEIAEEYAKTYEVIKNFDKSLSVPTYITQYDGTWFIVDCYHNRIIYSDTLGAPLDEWYIMTGDVTMPHTICSDGTIYLVDDTENNRILVFEKIDSKYINTQVMYNIGQRPHYSVYDEITDTFYVLSSTTGELYCFRHTADSTRLYLSDIRTIPELDGIYVRSFSIIDGDIYFVSGVSDEGKPAYIYRCELSTLEIKETIPVPDNLAGMVQITKIQDYYYITTSTDLSGNQDSATIVRTKKLQNLSKGNYEDIYSAYFVGGGTPYYISKVGDTYFLTEHRLKDHSIWSFAVNNNNIENVTTVY